MRGASKHPTMPRTAPPQHRSIQLKMPVVWRLIDPALDDTSSSSPTDPLFFNDMGCVSLSFAIHAEQYLWAIFKNIWYVSEKLDSKVLFMGRLADLQECAALDLGS